MRLNLLTPNKAVAQLSTVKTPKTTAFSPEMKTVGQNQSIKTPKIIKTIQKMALEFKKNTILCATEALEELILLEKEELEIAHKFAQKGRKYPATIESLRDTILKHKAELAAEKQKLLELENKLALL